MFGSPVDELRYKFQLRINRICYARLQIGFSYTFYPGFGRIHVEIWIWISIKYFLINTLLWIRYMVNVLCISRIFVSHFAETLDAKN